VKSVTLVDIDPAVTRLASSQADLVRLNQAAFHDARVCVLAADGVAPGERVTVKQRTKIAAQFLDDREYELADIWVFNVDADRFVREIGEDYHVVIVDFPDPKIVEVAKLFSVEFYRSLADKLAPGALCSIQASSPYAAREVFLCIGKSLHVAGLTALPYHDNVPSFGEWGWYLAWSGGPEPEAMRARLRDVDRIPVPTAYLTPEVVAAAFVFGKSWPGEVEELQANTRMRPAVVRYYRQAWQ
jgi:spermidine synthase